MKSRQNKQNFGKHKHLALRLAGLGSLALLLAVGSRWLNPHSAAAGRVETQAVQVSQTFSNATPLSIPRARTAGAYPSTITVANLLGRVRKVSVTLNNVFTQAAPALDVLLVGPQGQALILMSDAGNDPENPSILQRTITFEDAAPQLPVNTFIGDGSFRPGNYAANDTYPSPAPTNIQSPANLGTATLASVFNGSNPNGQWQLFIRNRSTAFDATINGGWALTLNTDTLFVTNLNSSGAGSLRQAIADVPSGGEIRFQAGLQGTISTTEGTLVLNKNLTITGPGAPLISVSGNEQRRVFTINSGAQVKLSGLTITQGRELNGNDGGGLANAGTLTLEQCTVSNNRVLSGHSGGGLQNTGNAKLNDCTFTDNRSGLGNAIDNRGGMTINHCLISGNLDLGANGSGGAIHNASAQALLINNSTIVSNQASSLGGGLYNFSGVMTLTSCTIASNFSTLGGGIYNHTTGTLNLSNCTLSGNLSLSNGGVSNSGNATLESCTITGNQGQLAGAGGAGNGSGAATVRNCLIALNAGGFAPDVAGEFTSLGHNLIGVAFEGMGFIHAQQGDLVGTPGGPLQPALAPLGNYGGPTQTHALLPESPALNNGDTAHAPATDQRGLARTNGGVADIGAFENHLTITPASLPDGVEGLPYQQQFTATGGTAPLAFALFSGAFPNGVTLASNGLLSGTPASTGFFFNNLIQATDAAGFAAVRAYSFTILCAAIPAVTTLNVPLSGSQGVFDVSASGTCDWAAFGNDPWIRVFGVGLGNGVVSFGIDPSPTPRTGSIRLNGRLITVHQLGAPANCPALTLHPANLPNGSLGEPYAAALTVSGGSGTPTLVVADQGNGQLPPGLQLKVNGELSGTPTQGGAFDFIVKAVDQNGCAAERNYRLVIRFCPSELTVESLGDTPDATPGDSVCTDANNACTLRAALMEANALPNCGEIEIRLFVQGTLNLASALPTIQHDVTLSGPGASELNIRRNATEPFRVLEIGVGRQVNIRDVAISNGKVTGLGNCGGGLRNFGSLRVERAVLRGNEAAHCGGGFHNESTFDLQTNTGTLSEATLEDCEIRDNLVTGDLGESGGLSNNQDCTLIVRRSTIANNRVVGPRGSGGGVGSGGYLTLEDSAVTGNTAPSSAGISAATREGLILNTTISGNTNTAFGGSGILLALFCGAGPGAFQLDVVNSTITNNSGPADTRAIVLSNGCTDRLTVTMRIRNTLVAGNPQGNFLARTVTNLISLGHNLDSDGSSGFSNNVNGDRVGTLAAPLDARLAPLGHYGGPTQTHALLCGSPALDAGDNCVLTNSCTANPLGFDLAFDQRGAPRQTNSAIDIGAFETNVVLAGTLPHPVFNVPYHQLLTASGGAGDQRFALVSGALPNGLTLAPNGALTGTPTRAGGFRFIASATDEQGFAGACEYALTVGCPVITIRVR